jgi:hypothetical protein
VELVQVRHVGGQEDVLEVAEVPLRVDQLGEGVGQVKLLQVVEIGQNSGMEYKEMLHRVLIPFFSKV